MGCSQSRKESSFNEEEIKKIKILFQKTVNSYPDTKDKNELNVQAFREFFPENVPLGEKLHEFMLKNSANKKVDIDIFIEVLELILRKPSNKQLGDIYLKHDKTGLICAILFPHMRKCMKENKYMNILINYSEGLDFVLTILHMLNGQPDQKVNDAQARTIVDRIFPTNDGNQENYNFETLATQLQSFTGETFILLQFVDQQGNKYTIGGFNPLKWGQLANDSIESYIFSIVPKYRHYYPLLDAQFSKPLYSQYCFLNTSESYGRELGLVFGINKQDCRIWLDGKDLSKSYANNSEKFFKKGNLLPSNAENLTCTLVEVYGVQTDQTKRNFSYSTINNMQLNQILAGSRDLRASLTTNLESTRQSNLGKSGFQSTYVTGGLLYRNESGNEEIVKRSAPKTTESTYLPQSYITNTTYTAYTSQPQSYTASTTPNPASSLPEYRSYYTGGNTETNYQFTPIPEAGRYSSQQPSTITYTYQTMGERKTTVN